MTVAVSVPWPLYDSRSEDTSPSAPLLALGSAFERRAAFSLLDSEGPFDRVFSFRCCCFSCLDSWSMKKGREANWFVGLYSPKIIHAVIRTTEFTVSVEDHVEACISLRIKAGYQFRVCRSRRRLQLNGHRSIILNEYLHFCTKLPICNTIQAVWVKTNTLAWWGKKMFLASQLFF